MKCLALAIALSLLCLRLQSVHSKPAATDELQTLVAHMVQMARHTRSLQIRQEDDDETDGESTGFGTCNSQDLTSLLEDYPEDCAQDFVPLFVSSDLEIGSNDFIEEFVTVLCNERCGQPIVDAFNECDSEELAEDLAFSCNTNENGATCGSMVNTTSTLTMAAAEACNCSSPCTTCPAGCREALQNVQDMVGCCGNAADLAIVQSMESEEVDSDEEVDNDEEVDSDEEVDDDEEESEEEEATEILNLCGVQQPTACSPGPLRADAKGLLVAKAAMAGFTVLAMFVLLF